MKLAIMQPYLFPYIGYFQLINSVDQFVIYDDVNYIKNGWINRNRILLNEEPFWITLPLSGASSNKLINEIGIIPNHKEKTKIFKTICQAYTKAPYFKNCIDMIEDIVLTDEKDLTKYLYRSIVLLNKYLGINKDIIQSSAIIKNNSLKAQDRIIDICKRLNAQIYINPIGGMELYSKKNFRDNDITLHFLKTNDIIYKQFNNTFIPNLSIIDVLMFNSLSDINKMLINFELL